MVRAAVTAQLLGVLLLPDELGASAALSSADTESQLQSTRVQVAKVQVAKQEAAQMAAIRSQLERIKRTEELQQPQLRHLHHELPVSTFQAIRGRQQRIPSVENVQITMRAQEQTAAPDNQLVGQGERAQIAAIQAEMSRIEKPKPESTSARLERLTGQTDPHKAKELYESYLSAVERSHLGGNAKTRIEADTENILGLPTSAPSEAPTTQPTAQPSMPTSEPTKFPTPPTQSPTVPMTVVPTANPTSRPTVEHSLDDWAGRVAQDHQLASEHHHMFYGRWRGGRVTKRPSRIGQADALEQGALRGRGMESYYLSLMQMLGGPQAAGESKNSQVTAAWAQAEVAAQKAKVAELEAEAAKAREAEVLAQVKASQAQYSEGDGAQQHSSAAAPAPALASGPSGTLASAAQAFASITP